MIYAYDEPVQLPVRDLYDTQMMAMAINAAKDMYDKAEKRIDDFYKEYGEFISPFAKDMDRYNEIIGSVRRTINDLYDSGEDPLRSMSGRAKMAAAIRAVNPAELSAMKANAKVGYAYLDAAQKLRSLGKYSEALELFDIALSGGVNFLDFATRGESGFNIWNRTSPIEATTLRDLTYDSYKGRSARILNAQDFNDPRLASYKYDPRYEWTGYLDSDLMKVAPGASLALAGDPRAEFFRDLARQKVIARGENPTTDAVEKQFLRDIADANSWALIDPTKKADEFALDDYRTNNDIRAEREKQKIAYLYKHMDDGDVENNSNGGYSLLKDIYATTLAQACGMQYVAKNGVSVNQLKEMMGEARKRQIAAINNHHNVLAATGSFISPDKINGVIPSDGESGQGVFLDPAYVKNLCTEETVRRSFKGWISREEPHKSDEKKANDLAELEKIVSAFQSNNGVRGYRIKVVPITDKNGNNMYSMVGDDNRWHTYARVRVYYSNGSKTRGISGNGKDGSVLTHLGKEMLLPVGLLSNENAASPDLSIDERERVGIKPFKTVKSWIGNDGNKDFPWGTNIINENTR